MPRSLVSISAGVLLVVILGGLLHARRPDNATVRSNRICFVVVSDSNTNLLVYLQWRVERLLCREAPLCSAVECELKQLDRHTQVMNFMCMLRRPLTQAKIHVRALVRTSGGLRPSMVDTTVDYCELLAEPGFSTNMLGRVLQRYMLHNSNMNHSCPVEGITLYRDIRVTPGWVMNSWVPKDRYRIDLRFYDQSTNETIILVQIFTST